MDMTVAKGGKFSFSISAKDLAKLAGATAELMRNILREPELPAARRNDYAFIASALVSAANNRDAVSVKACFLALKNLCAGFKFLNVKLKAVEKVLAGALAGSD